MTPRQTKTYMKKYHARWYRKNKKRVQGKHKARYRKNRKRELELSKLRYRRNRKRILMISRRNYSKNKAKRGRQGIIWVRKNIKRWRLYIHKWIRKPEARYAATRRRSRLLKTKGKTGRFISFSQYLIKVCFADGSFRPCHYCLGENNVTGSGLDRMNNDVNYTKENTIACCRSCNIWKNRQYTYKETMAHFKPLRDAAKEKNQ